MSNDELFNNSLFLKDLIFSALVHIYKKDLSRDGWLISQFRSDAAKIAEGMGRKWAGEGRNDGIDLIQDALLRYMNGGSTGVLHGKD